MILCKFNYLPAKSFQNIFRIAQIAGNQVKNPKFFWGTLLMIMNSYTTATNLIDDRLAHTRVIKTE